MVLAFAGDSTMTSDMPSAPSVPVSISVTTVFFFLRFPAVFRIAISVYCLWCLRRWRRNARAFDECAEVVQCDASFDLNQGPFDQLFELEGRHDPMLRKSQQVAPCIRCES